MKLRNPTPEVEQPKDLSGFETLLKANKYLVLCIFTQDYVCGRKSPIKFLPTYWYDVVKLPEFNTQIKFVQMLRSESKEVIEKYKLEDKEDNEDKVEPGMLKPLRIIGNEKPQIFFFKEGGKAKEIMNVKDKPIRFNDTGFKIALCHETGMKLPRAEGYIDTLPELEKILKEKKLVALFILRDHEVEEEDNINFLENSQFFETREQDVMKTNTFVTRVEFEKCKDICEKYNITEPYFYIFFYKGEIVLKDKMTNDARENAEYLTCYGGEEVKMDVHEHPLFKGEMHYGFCNLCNVGVWRERNSCGVKNLRCGKCKFTVCEGCIEKMEKKEKITKIEKIKFIEHEHELLPYIVSGRCNVCNRVVQFDYCFFCKECRYYLCQECQKSSK